METIDTTNLKFTFIQLSESLISEIWVDNADEEQYRGEIIIYMN